MGGAAEWSWSRWQLEQRRAHLIHWLARHCIWEIVKKNFSLFSHHFSLCTHFSGSAGYWIKLLEHFLYLILLKNTFWYVRFGSSPPVRLTTKKPQFCLLFKPLNASLSHIAISSRTAWHQTIPCIYTNRTSFAPPITTLELHILTSLRLYVFISNGRRHPMNYKLQKS